MSIAAEELMNQLNLTSKNEAVDEPDIKPSIKSINNNFTTFPWLHGILRKCREAIGTRHTSSLDGLLYAFVKELSVSIKDCYSRPNRAAKLRNIVNEILVYFDMIYQDLKAEYVDNNNTYLYLMSDLLSIYLDLEIKASKRGVHSLKKIGQFMTSALYTHLGQSEEHILDAILKAKLITKSAGELCAPVLLKILNDSKCFIGDENAYVRFLLAFKLLHKITKRSDRRTITKMAMKKLDPAPELVEIVRKMNHIFPAQQISNEPMTLYLMNAKFDFIKAKREFLKSSSINNGSLSDFYSEKRFPYESRSSNIVNLLKKNKKDGQGKCFPSSSVSSSSKGIKSCFSSDLDLDPSVYRISSYMKDQNSVVIKEDDCSEVEFLGVKNKIEKHVVVITLDSDEEMQDAKERTKDSKMDLTTIVEPENKIEIPVDVNEETVDDGKEKKGQDMSASDSGKVGTDLTKTISNVPESEKCSTEDICKETSSTKREGGEFSSILQSPGHGVIDSTSNSIGSIFDGNFSKDKTYEYQSSGLWDEGRIEVTSSLDFIDSTDGKFNDDSTKTKDSEISSTFLLNDCFAFFSNDEYKSNPSVSNEPVSKLVQSCEYSIVQNLRQSDSITQETCKKQQGSNKTEVRKYNRDCNKTDNLMKDSAFQSTAAKQKKPGKKSEKECDSQQNNLSSADVKISEKEFEPVLKYQSPGIQRKSMKQESLKGNDFYPKTLAITSGNLEQLINAPAKKVNYENVAKSYKIVKSNRLKSSSIKNSNASNKLTSDSSMNSTSQNQYKCPPKFIKIDKSSVIVNSMKFVTKNVDSQTSQMFQEQTESGKFLKEKKIEPASNISVALPSGVSLKLSLDGNVQKSIASNGSQSSATNDQAVKLFKKVVGNLGVSGKEKPNPEGSISALGQYVRVQKPDNQNVGRSTLKINNGKTEQTSSKKRKPNTKTVIKTDINMKSILKHINPSSIPQFAAEAVKDNKRKYPENLQQCDSGKNAQEGKVIRITNIATESKKDIKLVCPRNFLLKPSPQEGLNHLQNNGKMGTEEGLTNQSCLPSEPFMAQSPTYFDPNKDRLNTSFVSISQADTTVNNVGVDFLMDRVSQFPDTYTNEIVPPFSKSLSPLSYIPEVSAMRNESIQSDAHQLGFDGRYLDNIRIAPPVTANEKLETSDTVLISEDRSIGSVEQKSVLKFNAGFTDAPDRFSIINCKGIHVTDSNKFPEKEEIGRDLKSICKTNLNEDRAKCSRGDLGCNKYEHHGRTSSMEVGLTFSNLRSPSKAEVNAPRDVIISETSPEELKDVDDEMRAFVEPWDEPRDYLPNDEEYFKRGLPDPQNLFSEEDLFPHFDKLFPFPNSGRDILRMDDIDFDAFDDKCLCDVRGDHDLNDSLFMSTFSDNFADENTPQALPGNEIGAEDDRHKEDDHSRFDSGKDSPARTSGESKKNFLGRLRYRRALDCCGLRESVHTRVCFHCLCRRRWIRIRSYMLKLRAVRLKVISRLHEADRLKSQDDELLRRIEESFKKKTVSVDNGKPYVSLPLKKRLRNLNMGEDETSSSPSLGYEKFPSYPTKPMISIAEVQMRAVKKEESNSPPHVRKPEDEKMPYRNKQSTPSVKSLSSLKLKADGSGKLGEVQETTVLAQVNSQPKQTDPVIKTPKSPISSSETENSQPQMSEMFEDRALGLKGEETTAPSGIKKSDTVPNREKMCSLRKRKTLKKKMKVFRNVR